MCSRATSGVDPFGWPIAKAIASPRGYATKEEKLESLLSVAQKVNCLSRGQPINSALIEHLTSEYSHSQVFAAVDFLSTYMWGLRKARVRAASIVPKTGPHP